MLISAFVFATQVHVVKFLSFPNPKFPASSQLCLYRSAYVRLIWKPHCWFSHGAAHLIVVQENAPSHLGLFCLHREISSENEKKKITPNTPKSESRLIQLIMMGESICQIWGKLVFFVCSSIDYC